VGRPGDVLAGDQQHERHHRQQPGGDRQQGGLGILLQRRAVLLDAVDPVGAALDLAHRGGPRDQRHQQAEQHGDQVADAAGPFPVPERGQDDVGGRSRRQPRERLAQDVAEVGLMEGGRQPDHRDHAG